MKKIFYILTVLLGIAACENQPIEFEDFEFKAVYFPIQRPLRTLSLGEDRIDNSLDKQYIFDVAVSIGGMYKNKKDWTVDYVVDPTLTDKVYTNTTPSLKIIPLPTQYYTLDPVNSAIIPKGSFNGRIRVQLKSEFFDDPLALTGQYVIPLRITNTSADSILMGKPALSNPDPRVTAHWESNKSPKYWVMYGIKYVNAYHGNYLHRGQDVRKNSVTGVVEDTIIFRNKYVEYDALIKLITINRNKVFTNGVGNIIGSGHSMVLTFTNENGASGAVTISPAEDALYEVTGSGHYNDKASSVEVWTLLTWQSMYLNYIYDDGTYIHNIHDTLVFRDRGIKWEEIPIKIED